MTQEYTSEPDATDSPSDYEGLLLAGVRDTFTLTYGEDEPSSAGFEEDEEVGRTWLSPKSPGSAESPRLYIKQQQEAATPGYGYRPMKLQKVLFPDVGNEITFAPPSPQAANTGWVTLSLKSLLDLLQDAGWTEPLVGAVRLHILVRTGASETVGATNAYFQVRTPGSTGQPQTVKAQVQNFELYASVLVELDENEQLEWQVVVGGVTPSFSHRAWITEIYEPF